MGTTGLEDEGSEDVPMDPSQLGIDLENMDEDEVRALVETIQGMVDDRMESAGVEGDMDLEDMTPEQMKELFGDDIEFIDYDELSEAGKAEIRQSMGNGAGKDEEEDTGDKLGQRLGLSEPAAPSSDRVLDSSLEELSSDSSSDSSGSYYEESSSFEESSESETGMRDTLSTGTDEEYTVAQLRSVDAAEVGEARDAPALEYFDEGSDGDEGGSAAGGAPRGGAASGGGGGGGAGAAAAAASAASGATSYRGVVREADGSYWAVADVAGASVREGPFMMALEAAEAYDAAATRAGAGAGELNFPTPGLLADWKPPGKRERANLIPERRGEPLDAEEVAAALREEGGEDVRVIHMNGRSPLCNAMVFATGSTQAHMRRLADLVVDAYRKRRLRKRNSLGVEGRDCNDWMVVDADSLVVNVFERTARRTYNIEAGWQRVSEDGQFFDDDEEEVHEDDWLELNPIPEDHPAAREVEDEEELATLHAMGEAHKGMRVVRASDQIRGGAQQ